jgi:hypothetical protein
MDVTPTGNRGKELLAGMVLLVLGLFFLGIRLTGRGGQYVLVAIGAAFLLSYVLTRDDDLLAPGSLLTGLGLGIALRPAEWEQGTSVLLGLGVGLLAMHVLTVAFAKRSMAPSTSLLPGTALTILGLIEALAAGGLLRFIAVWWPVAVVLAGALILRQHIAGPGRRSGTSPNEAADA